MESRKKILMIEDSQDLCLLWEHFFAESHYDIEFYHTGSSALDRLKAGPPVDIVVSDYILTDISGLELLKTVRELFPDLPCILVTGFHDDELENKIKQIPNVAFLTKPIRFQALEKTIRMKLQNSSPAVHSSSRLAPTKT